MRSRIIFDISLKKFRPIHITNIYLYLMKVLSFVLKAIAKRTI